MAGDLTIYGERQSVIVLRDEQGVQIPYRVDLTSARQLYISPVYYLQQNDVVYVEPNKVKAQNSEIGSATGLWLSGTSILISVATLLINILK